MAHITLRHIQTFLAVVDNDCSITKAADFLHIAQPAVSQTIADVETHYNLQLFDRLKRRLYLTNAGEKLLPYARRAVDDFDIISTVMQHGTELAPLRIGASLTVGTAVLPSLLQTIYTNNSEFESTVLVENTKLIEQAILDSKIDIAIVEGSIHSTDIIQKYIIDDKLIAVCAPPIDSEPLLNDLKWILREKGSGTRDLSEEAFNVDVGRENIWSVSNTQTIIELVKAGLGITIISQTLVQNELDSGVLFDCSTKYLRGPVGKEVRSFRLIYHKDKLLDKRMQFFIKACKILKK